MRSPSPKDAEYFRLRAEWLRYKNHIWDTNTELPTLPAVLDEVRRLMEERGAIGLLYLDIGGDGGIEMMHGWQTYDDVLRAFARALGSLRGDGVLGPRDIVTALSVRSDKFLLFVRGSEGDLLDSTSLGVHADRLCTRLREALPRFVPQTLTTPLTFHQGHSLMYRDPLLRAERAVHRALDEAMFMSLRQRTKEEDRQVHELDALLASGRVRTLRQPIMDLETLDVLGLEVFTWGPPDGQFDEAERLFSLAERTGRLIELERLCRKRALSLVPSLLRPGQRLFLNTSARALQDDAIAGKAFRAAVEQAGLTPQAIVLEITERIAVEERQSYADVLHALKQDGFGIAIDDMGAGYSSLRALVDVEPDFLKFDVSLVRNIDRNRIKRSLLETLVDLARRIGAQVIAEGIEAESEYRTLREMGLRLGQGHYLAPPEVIDETAG